MTDKRAGTPHGDGPHGEGPGADGPSDGGPATGGPAGGGPAGGGPSALDGVIPTWDRRERHRLPVSADAGTVIRAAEELTWGEVPSFRRTMAAAGMGRVRFSRERPVLSMFLDNGFRMLHRSEDQLVVGGIERISRKQPIVAMGEEPAAEFRDFEAPSHILIAFDFRYADGVLTTETRVRCTDAKARRLFGAYWFVIRPGSGAIRHIWLRGIRRRVLRGQDGLQSGAR
ncbi:hypothetical protein [Streptomyces alkaliterrae]|uniref:DUF2867 domain-containing protein n=1 Tax=Streptomyces alkaliterrae TaxID=2213162 RepID=A0A5P0YLG7_9ACTN|nr:hypothetical protein [Streptomyces alkaliterrae]MBB1258526.1 hypothetical protein [Streptomyces alkaliterrae]MQS00477.1 hypothetical protein [Streptomyces alkaliterrae]